VLQALSGSARILGSVLVVNRSGCACRAAAQEVEQALATIREMATENPDATLTITWQVDP